MARGWLRGTGGAWGRSRHRGDHSLRSAPTAGDPRSCPRALSLEDPGLPGRGRSRRAARRGRPTDATPAIVVSATRDTSRPPSPGEAAIRSSRKVGNRVLIQMGRTRAGGLCIAPGRFRRQEGMLKISSVANNLYKTAYGVFHWRGMVERERTSASCLPLREGRRGGGIYTCLVCPGGSARWWQAHWASRSAGRHG